MELAVRNNSGIKLVFRVLLLAGAYGYSCLVLAEVTTGNLKIISEFFSQPKYSLGSGEARPLMKESEFHPDFIDLLNPYPEALESARDSLSYSGITLTGNIILTLGAAYGLIDTLDDKSDLDNNQLPENDDNQDKALAIVIVGAIISIYGNSKANSSLNRAVEIFNQRNNAGLDFRNSQAYFNQKKQNAFAGTPVFSFRLKQNKNKQEEIVALTRVTFEF